MPARALGDVVRQRPVVSPDFLELVLCRCGYFEKYKDVPGLEGILTSGVCFRIDYL